jgi:Zn-dependent peptidase ImmA (M78 family)
MQSSPPTWARLGQRVAGAREALGRTVEATAAAAGLSGDELRQVECGRRDLSAGELARLAAALEVGVDWFLTESPPAVRSLRAERAEGTVIARVDLLLEQLARDVELLSELNLLQRPRRDFALEPPNGMQDTSRAADEVRRRFNVPSGPLLELDRHAETLGLYAFCRALGTDEPDGAYVALEWGGVVLVNGSHPSGRRRFTLAHEIGHHVFADEYATDWFAASSQDREKLINAFAAHLLLPKDDIVPRFQQLLLSHELRAAVLALAVQYRVSWSVACAQCRRFDLLDDVQYEGLRSLQPTRAEHLDLGERVVEELVPPSISPGLAKAILAGYRKHKLGPGRAIEMLRGTLEVDELPARDDVPLEAYASDLDRVGS